MRAFRFAAVLVAVPLLLATAVQAQDPSGDQAPDAAVAAQTEAAVVVETPQETATLDEVVCRAQGRAASRLQSRARVCKTRREWRVLDDDAAAAAARTQNRDRYTPPQPTH
tara:strand:+ start:214 stop:546 length:333 start_codon:yes stop_codon:yes gene_type:complete